MDEFIIKRRFWNSSSSKSARKDFPFRSFFRWNTEFSSVKKQSVKLKYTFDKFNTSLQGVVEHLTDYIYFDEIINLKQAESNILISKIKLKLNPLFLYNLLTLEHINYL